MNSWSQTHLSAVCADMATSIIMGEWSPRGVMVPLLLEKRIFSSMGRLGGVGVKTNSRRGMSDLPLVLPFCGIPPSNKWLKLSNLQGTSNMQQKQERTFQFPLAQNKSLFSVFYSSVVVIFLPSRYDWTQGKAGAEVPFADVSCGIQPTVRKHP